MSDSVIATIFSIVLLLLLIVSMFFSGIDMAFGCVNINHLEKYYEEKHKKSTKLAIKFAKNYDQTISTILLCNDLTNVAIEVISIIFSTYLALALKISNVALVTLITSIIFIFLLIFIGEILPKSLGKIYSFSLCHFGIYIILFFYYLFYPVTFLVKYFIKFISYPITHNIKDIKISDDELIEMVDEIEDEGIVDEEKANMLRGTIDYANTEAYEVMTPRVDIYAFDIEDNINELLENDETFIHSRIPVYKDSIDNIIGFILTTDLVRVKLENKEINDINQIIFKCLFFPRSTEINDIFKKFKETKIHFGVVLDEYGGTEGIVTMEDILEEIVGEIRDESDNIDAPYCERKNGTFIVDGGMNLEDFFDLMDLSEEDLEDTEYVTVAGFCIELLDDRFAKVGDIMKYKNITLKVLAVDEKKTIKKLFVSKLKEED